MTTPTTDTAERMDLASVAFVVAEETDSDEWEPTLDELIAEDRRELDEDAAWMGAWGWTL